ncbi:unnamed protein product [Boreogadus saida]
MMMMEGLGMSGYLGANRGPPSPGRSSSEPQETALVLGVPRGPPSPVGRQRERSDPRRFSGSGPPPGSVLLPREEEEEESWGPGGEGLWSPGTSDGSDGSEPKHWSRAEQGIPCTLAQRAESRKHARTEPLSTDTDQTEERRSAGRHHPLYSQWMLVEEMVEVVVVGVVVVEVVEVVEVVVGDGGA